MNSQRDSPMILGLVPAHNEEATIGRVIEDLSQFVNKVVVCDDGSSDKTSEIALHQGAEVIRHDTNLGYGSALATLFLQAIKLNADAAVTVDGDGQHDPRTIPLMVSRITRGESDLVVGSRFLGIRSNIPILRRLAIEAITRLNGTILHYHLTDSQCGMRAYGPKALMMTIPTTTNMGASLEILLKARVGGLRISEVPTYVRYDVGEIPFSSAILQMVSLFATIIRLKRKLGSHLLGLDDRLVRLSVGLSEEDKQKLGIHPLVS